MGGWNQLEIGMRKIEADNSNLARELEMRNMYLKWGIETRTRNEQ